MLLLLRFTPLPKPLVRPAVVPPLPLLGHHDISVCPPMHYLLLPSNTYERRVHFDRHRVTEAFLRTKKSPANRCFQQTSQRGDRRSQTNQLQTKIFSEQTLKPAHTSKRGGWAGGRAGVYKAPPESTTRADRSADLCEETSKFPTPL